MKNETNVNSAESKTIFKIHESHKKSARHLKYFIKISQSRFHRESTRNFDDSRLTLLVKLVSVDEHTAINSGYNVERIVLKIRI